MTAPTRPGFLLALIAGLLVLADFAAGQESSNVRHDVPRADLSPTTAPDFADAGADETTTTQPAEKKPYSQPPFFRLDYSGDFWHAPAMTGDWGGLRNQLAERGLSLNVDVIQYGMMNAYGGKSTNGGMAYSGTAQYLLQIDTWRAKMWPGGYIRLRGETEFGHSINGRTGSIASPNFDALLPVPNDPGETTLTEAWMMQFLSEKAYVLGGKVDLTNLPGGNEFQGGRFTQFLNTAFWYPPTLFTLVPYSAMTAGVGLIPTKWFDMATLVIDSYGQPNRTGFDTAFHTPNGVTVLQNFTFHVKPFDLPGNQRIYGVWSSRGRYDIDDLGRLGLSEAIGNSFDPRLGSLNSTIRRRYRVGGRVRGRLARKLVSNTIAPSQDNQGWGIWYNFDQYLYTEPQDKTQGVGVFGNFSWVSDGTNPVTTFYSIGLGGKGIIPKRDQDRFGVGYYLLNMSNEFPQTLNLSSEQGVELFYNVEVTPWFHLTPDVQVIVDPGAGAGDREPAIAFGVRGQISF